MSFKPRNTFSNQGNDQKASQGAIRKSILRNPEIPLPQQKSAFFNEKLKASKPSGASLQSKHNKENHQFVHNYHEPRLNNIEDLKRKLTDIKAYEARTLVEFQNKGLLPQSTANKEVEPTRTSSIE